MTLHILIVDDKPAIRESVSVILSKLGCSFEEASNGLSALEKTKQDNFDLFIIDHLMPIMDGLKLIHNLKAASRTKNTPIIFMSTQNISELEGVDEVNLCERVIPKPIDEKSFEIAINQLINTKSIAHSL